MSLRATLLLAALTVASTAPAHADSTFSIASMPPSVILTVPQAGDTAVDPGLKEMRVTFSKDMMTQEMWSWCSQTPETFPKCDTSAIHYLDDRRTCVLPVSRQPGKTYVIWINSQKFGHFKDASGHSAVPYLLVFQTADKGLASTQDAAKKAATSAAQAWLALVDKGDSAESWKTGAHYFKNALSQEQWGQALQAARIPLGKTLSRKLLSQSYETSLPGAPDGEYVVIQYDASFEGKKVATETVTPVLDSDGVWRVSGYYIQ